MWDFARGECTLTFSDHQQPGICGSCLAGRAVSYSGLHYSLGLRLALEWGLSSLWRYGPLLQGLGRTQVTPLRSSLRTRDAALDDAVPLSSRGQCLASLRGHADSINAVSFLPFSNTICSCSADKTLSLWDARTVRECCLTHHTLSLTVHGSLPAGPVCADLLRPPAGL